MTKAADSDFSNSSMDIDDDLDLLEDTTASQNGDSSSAEKEELAQKETTAVLRLRVLVILSLLVAALVVSLIVYLVVSNGEQKTFESDFDGASKRLLNAFDEIVQQKIMAIASFSSSVTAYARASNSEWPFVLVPDYHERAVEAKRLSGALSMGLQVILNDDNVRAWGPYSYNNSDWIFESRDAQREEGFEVTDYMDRFLQEDNETETEPELFFHPTTGYPNEVYSYDRTGQLIVDPGPGPYTPLWQGDPVMDSNGFNLNIVRFPQYGPPMRACVNSSEIILGGIDVGGVCDPFYCDDPTRIGRLYARLLSYQRKEITIYRGDPVSSVYLPVFDSFNKDTRKQVAIISSSIRWEAYFENTLTSELGAVTVVVENCDATATFEVNGPQVDFLGLDDFHDRAYSDMVRAASFKSLINEGKDDDQRIRVNQDYCPYSIRVYPTKDFEDTSTSNMPVIITCSVAAIFVFTAIMFVIYDRLVETRQKLVMNTAVKSTAIVSSLFPKNIQDRLLAGDASNANGKKSGFSSDKNRLKSFLTGGDQPDDEVDLEPIADLFPECTVLFADITGFTSWSSTREPAHVFILLQTVYQAFDGIAKRFRVFKVETIGDSYVAVTGLPNPQGKHAILMARFAWECLHKLSHLTRKLEASLGPDTADLGMRFGMHSGPVTAGVLRGDRARFQLFGDTVNTAARMESTGERNMIQASQSTARLLEAAGKESWLTSRSKSVAAKGKGVLETYWIIPKSDRGTSEASWSEEANQLGPSRRHDAPGNVAKPRRSPGADDNAKQDRLIDWMCKLIVDHLRPVVARRRALGVADSQDPSSLVYKSPNGKTCLDEVQECVRLPKFDSSANAINKSDVNEVQIDDVVMKQLYNYICFISAHYRANPFHNFEHAAHVTMAVDKFLKRIVRPDIEIESEDAVASHLHDYTHGINSDPTAILAIVLSAMIHDLDHRGVGNAQLCKEEKQMGELYKAKSVAEQNSLDLAWNALMAKEYDALRVCMFGNRTDMFRFRQVLVNVVLATDIFDKELNDLRKNRWKKAFSETHKSDDFNDLRATIVIEHIIQASDVSHTMQHWHVYRKWNLKLFTEMHEAFKAGRMGKDPATFWYKGELGFFDNYVIPLAKKLKDCNVFGVSSDECLNYALQNRAEWEQRGETIVAEIVASLTAQGNPATWC